jgi:hypothetical protein
MDLRVALKKHCEILMSYFEYLKKVHENWLKRVEKCIEQEGGHLRTCLISFSVRTPFY